MQINRPQMLSRVDYKPIRGAVPRNQNPQERWWSAVHKSWSDQTGSKSSHTCPHLSQHLLLRSSASQLVNWWGSQSACLLVSLLASHLLLQPGHLPKSMSQNYPILSPKLDMWIISTILVLYPSPCPDIHPICLSVHHGATPVSDMLFLPKKSDIFEDAKPGHQTSSQYEQSSFGPTNSPKIFVKSLKSAHQTSSGSASADLR